MSDGAKGTSTAQYAGISEAYALQMQSVGLASAVQLPGTKRGYTISDLLDSSNEENSKKTQEEKGFYTQRRRWLATQFAQWGRVFKDLPRAILSGNIDYSDKLIQWILPPRLILFGGIIVMGSVMQIVDWPLALKWWALFLIMGITLCLAIPDKLVDEQFKKSIRKLPLLFIMMVANLFRMKGMNKKFVSTEKNGSSTL